MKPLEEMGKFKTVVIDPPWPFKLEDNKGNSRYNKGATYQTIPLSEIAAFPVNDVCDNNSNCFIWTVQKYLPYTFSLLEEWRLNYRFTMVWHKPKGHQYHNSPSSNAEFVVVGGKGNANWQDTKAFSLVFNMPMGMHSEKPEGFYDLLRRVTPAPRLDIFGRRRIAGFHSWGDEAPEQDEPLPDHYQVPMLG